MTGSPGAGKTLMALSLPSILPRLGLDEALDITHIYSVTGQLSTDTPLVNQRTFCSPHHTIRYAGLVGGGKLPRPGQRVRVQRGRPASGAKTKRRRIPCGDCAGVRCSAALGHRSP